MSADNDVVLHIDEEIVGSFARAYDEKNPTRKPNQSFALARHILGKHPDPDVPHYVGSNATVWIRRADYV